MARGGVVFRGATAKNYELTAPGTAGQVLTSNGEGADPTFEDASGGGNSAVFQFVRATSDEVVNNSNTIQADNELTITVGANEDWEFEFVVTYISTTAADFRCGLKFPTSPTQIAYGIDGLATNAAGSASSMVGDRKQTAGLTADAATGADFGGDTNAAVVVLKGFVRNGSNAGSVTLWWAQATTTAVDTTRKAGSWVEARRFA